MLAGHLEKSLKLKYSRLAILNPLIDLSVVDREELDTLDFSLVEESFHPKRRLHFTLGRLCALKALKRVGYTGSFKIQRKGTAPVWPDLYIGSISHCEVGVIAVAAPCRDIWALGLDIEGRGRIKEQTSRIVRTNEDILKTSAMSESDLLTLIFSGKEAFYKTLYPRVNKFFGFDSAAIIAINEKDSSFTLKLLRDIGGDECRAGQEFTGRFFISEEYLVTCFEISADDHAR